MVFRLLLLIACLIPVGCVAPLPAEREQSPELQAVDTAESHYQRGLSLMAERNFEHALLAFSASLQVFPNQHRAHFRLARCHYYLGDYALEVLEYRKCLLLNPQHRNALYHLGSAYTAMDEIGKAQDCFRDLLALAPGHPDAQSALIMLEAVAASSDRAVQQY